MLWLHQIFASRICGISDGEFEWNSLSRQKFKVKELIYASILYFYYDFGVFRIGWASGKDGQPSVTETDGSSLELSKPRKETAQIHVSFISKQV
jgi:hypothetical protein